MPSLSAWKKHIKANNEGVMFSTIDRDGKTVEAQAIAGGKLVGHWLDAMWESERQAKLAAAKAKADEQNETDKHPAAVSLLDRWHEVSNSRLPRCIIASPCRSPHVIV